MIHPSGLSATSVRVYRLRVAHATDSAEALARRAGLEPGDVAKAECELTELGLLCRSPNGGWTAVSPENAVEELVASAEQQILRQQITVASVRARLTALSGHYLEARSMRSARGDIEIVHGAPGIRSVIEDLARTCTESLDTFAPVSAYTEEALNSSLPIYRALLERGASVRILLRHSARRHTITAQWAAKLDGAGAQLRATSSLPARMLLFDRGCAVLPTEPGDSADGAILVRDTVVTGFLRTVFDHFWQDAASFLAGPDDTDSAPAGMDRDVLLLIAAGRTTQGIAAELGISPRTVNRISAELLSRLGADSRFQAGVRAAELGWLD